MVNSRKPKDADGASSTSPPTRNLAEPRTTPDRRRSKAGVRPGERALDAGRLGGNGRAVAARRRQVNGVAEPLHYPLRGGRLAQLVFQPGVRRAALVPHVAGKGEGAVRDRRANHDVADRGSRGQFERHLAVDARHPMSPPRVQRDHQCVFPAIFEAGAQLVVFVFPTHQRAEPPAVQVKLGPPVNAVEVQEHGPVLPLCCRVERGPIVTHGALGQAAGRRSIGGVAALGGLAGPIAGTAAGVQPLAGNSPSRRSAGKKSHVPVRSSCVRVAVMRTGASSRCASGAVAALGMRSRSALAAETVAAATGQRGLCARPCSYSHVTAFSSKGRSQRANSSSRAWATLSGPISPPPPTASVPLPAWRIAGNEPLPVGFPSM